MSDQPTVPYRLVLPLDRGGRFEVWRIEPVVDGSGLADDATVRVPGHLAGPPLALKCVSPAAGEARRLGAVLRREAGLQSQVVHPGIVPVELVEAGGQPAIVSALAIGSVASERCAGIRSTADEVAVGLRRIAEALAALHAAGIVHGDVAPSNVLRFGTGHGDCRGASGAALSDFGCASGSARQDGVAVCGTPGAAAPEVVEGTRPGPEADVYGLGRVGLAWLEASDRTGAAATVEAVESWCGLLTDPDPGRRPTAAAAAASLLLPRPPRTVEFGPRSPVPEAPGTPGRRTRRRVAQACAAIGVLVLCASAAVLVSGHRPVRRCGSVHPSGLLRRGQRRRLDVLGTGCAQRVTWSGTVLEIRTPSRPDVLRYRLGRPDDVLAFAEWNCEGPIRPALYRPRTGEVLRYPMLPTKPGTAGASHPTRLTGFARGGSVLIGRDARGCRELQVRGMAHR